MSRADAARVARARMLLLLDYPFFGHLALHLQIEADQSCETTATDGTTLFYSPSWVAAQGELKLIFAVAHEVMHPALGHLWRRGTRDPLRWNVACDYVINDLLVQAGLRPPPGALIEQAYRGLAAEQVYAKLPANVPRPHSMMRPPPKDAGRHGSSIGQSGNESAPKPLTQVDWQIAAAQAAIVGRRAGMVPGALDRAAKAAHVSQTEWRAYTRTWLQALQPSDTSWTRPNRRCIAHGIYLPGLLCESMPPIGIVVDTSGSIDARTLAMFTAELDTILRELRPERLDVVYCDTCVRGVESFEPDGPLVELRSRGGGGTAFQPALDHFTNASEPPAGVIYLTDGYASWPREPEYPVLWAMSESSTIRAVPFGELVVVRPYD